MAVTGAPWQLQCEKVEQRCGYLLKSGLWSDCTFVVGSETNQEVIHAHKLVLAMSSPVFEAMFYGGLSECKDQSVSTPDVHPEAFRALLQYIYTGNIDFDSFDLARNLWYAAKKYLLPHLEKQCNSYITSIVSPRNAYQAYELACFFDEKAVKDKCIQIISANTKEVLKDSSFLDMELKTLIKVCSLYHLDIDSELDLFNAVVRYAKANQNSTPVEIPSEKEFPSVEENSKASPAVEPDSKPATEICAQTSTSAKADMKKEALSIRAILQNIRFLAMTAEEFAEGPARSGLLTEAESRAVLENIISKDSAVPMPPGFSLCREPRQTRDDSKKCFDAGSLDHSIHSLKCGDPSQVKDAARAATDFLLGTPLEIQPALDSGILDALVPALTEGTAECKAHAARSIYNLCEFGSPAQLRVLAEGAALQPYCRLLIGDQSFSYWVLRGLINLLKKVEENTRTDLLQKLRALSVPELLMSVPEVYMGNREVADDLLRTYFSDQ